MMITYYLKGRKVILATWNEWRQYQDEKEIRNQHPGGKEEKQIGGSKSERQSFVQVRDIA